MAKFCSQCGTPLADGLSFCTQCGAKQENGVPQTGFQPAPRTPAAPSPVVQVLTGKVTEGKTAFLLLGEQLLALLLFFLPIMKTSYGSESTMYSVFTFLSTGNNTSAIHVILLMALIVSMGLFLLPWAKANGLQLQKPILSDKVLPLLLFGASVALFITNIVTFILASSQSASYSYFSVSVGLSVWGIFYIIVTVLANAHLGFCWWKSNK